MDPRVIEFLDTAKTKSLKDVLSKLNAKTGGNKAELNLRVEEYLKNLQTEEALELLPVGHLEGNEVTGKDDEDDPETSRNDLSKDKATHERSYDGDESQAGSDNEQNMDQEIERLREKINKKKKIAELKKQLSEISNEDSISTRTCSVTFRDVEESLYKFSGDDHFTIEKWITQFEEACEIYGWDQSAKFIHAKRLMYGTAKLFLRTVSVKNWPQLKYALVKEFKKNSSKAEIHTMLRNRKKRYNETYQQYVLSMQEIGTLADIDENDVIHYIIEGIPDTSNNKMLLYTANDLTDLKNVLKKYEKLRVKSTADPGSSYSNSSGIRKFKNVGDYKNNKQQIRCYNCNEMGHLSNMCAKEKRENGACFRCKKSGHHIKDCVLKPKLVNNLPTTASKDVHHTYSEVNDFEYFLDFNFFSDTHHQSNKFKLLTLIDSGSPISFVQQQFVSSTCIERMDPNQHKYYGINNSPLQLIGKIKCSICFNNELVNFVLFVVENFTMYYNVILGRDFLKECKMTITKYGNQNKINIDDHVQQQQQTCKKDNGNGKGNIIDETCDNFVSEILNINIDTNDEHLTVITNPNVPVETKINVEKLVLEAFSRDDSVTIGNKDHIKLSIQLTKSDPFYCTTRSSPYSHKEELRKIIDDLLQRGIIRESSSPYASPIVLVQEKNKELRLCVDYRELNKYTVKNNYPLELIDDILDSL